MGVLVGVILFASFLIALHQMRSFKRQIHEISHRVSEARSSTRALETFNKAVRIQQELDMGTDQDEHKLGSTRFKLSGSDEAQR